MTVYTPEVYWAQDASVIFLTVDLTDANATYVLTEDKLEYKATSDGKEYAFTLEFYQPVNKEESKIAKNARQTFFKLAKQTPGSPWWPRLTKEKSKLFWLKTDFNRWRDEDDDEAEDGSDAFGGMDFQNMMQGMGGGADFGSDSDDDYQPEADGEGDDVPPPLEEVKEETSEEAKEEATEKK
ncbi:hypothetical protein BGW41_003787 [Actinomortierella wolfii]|nr:hypothetical protein BGW41_003787 [Actinomortierella wolfii]